MKVIDKQSSDMSIAENSIVTIDLERNMDFRNLYLRLVFSFTHTAAPSYRAFFNAIANFIELIEIVLNGSITVARLTGQEAYTKARLDDHQAPALDVGTIATSPVSVSCMIPLNFILTYGRNPLDTILRSGKLATFQLRVKFGSVTGNVVTGGTAVALAAGGKVYVTERVSYGLPDDAKPSLKKLYSSELNVDVSGYKDIFLPVGNIINTITLMASNDGAPNDAAVVDVDLYSGAQHIQTLRWADLQQKNLQDMELGSVIPGVAQLNFGADGFISEVVDARLLSELKLKLNVAKQSGVTKVAYIVEEIVPPASGVIPAA